MRIAHNISALNTLNRINKNNKSMGSSLEKLSSGLHINKAEDNAAGLAISEKMRAQIRGLAQVERNIQDGISLIQTAECGLGIIQEPNLVRLRELAIQASNGILADTDRSAIQKEVDQIKQGINEIANNTNFNGINLLNNEIETIVTPVQESLNVNWKINIPTKQLSKTSDGGYIGVNSEWNYPLKIDRNGNLLWAEAIPSTNVYSIKESSDGGYILLGNDFSADSTSGQRINIIKWDSNLNELWKMGVSTYYSIEGNEVIEISDGSFVLVGTGSGIQNWDGLAAKFNNSGVQQSVSIIGSSQSNPVGYGNDEFHTIIELTDGGFLAVGTSSLRINSSYTDSSSWAVKYDGDLNPLWDIRVGSSGDDRGYDAIATSDGGAIVVGSYNDTEKTSGLIYKVDSSGNIVWEKNISNSTGTSSIFTSITKGTDGNYIIGGLLDGNPHIAVFNTQGSAIADFTINDGSLANTINSILSNDDGSYIVSSTSGIANINLTYGQNVNTTNNHRTLELQVGSNTGNSFGIRLTDARTTALGIDEINLSTLQGAESAISKIDKAIKIVSSERSRLGAYQNALDHIHSNASNYEVNLTAAESRIRDADMAKEMMEMTKYNILAQASQALLTQANQQSQGVLELLK